MSTLVVIQNEKALTTSMLVAEAFDKQHTNVLRDINNLDCSKEFHESNFRLMFVDKKIGNEAVRKDPSYTITRDGFVFLAMGYRGKKAAKFKEAYINAFNEMEKQIRERQLLSSQELLTKIDEQITKCKSVILSHRMQLRKLEDIAEVIKSGAIELNIECGDSYLETIEKEVPKLPIYNSDNKWTKKVLSLKVGENLLMPCHLVGAIRKVMQRLKERGEIFTIKSTTIDTPIGQAKVWRIK